MTVFPLVFYAWKRTVTSDENFEVAFNFSSRLIKSGEINPTHSTKFIEFFGIGNCKMVDET